MGMLLLIILLRLIIGAEAVFDIQRQSFTEAVEACKRVQAGIESLEARLRSLRDEMSNNPSEDTENKITEAKV